ncbi:MAG: NifU N-terminal domain-containing protein [Actinomycetota bacterium]
MGQPVTVVKKPSSNPGVVRFEINRSITGMGHERYFEAPGPELDRPCDELARRVFDHDGVESVHVNSNVITVNLSHGADDSALAQTIEDLFIYYRPGVEVPSFEG